MYTDFIELCETYILVQVDDEKSFNQLFVLTFCIRMKCRFPFLYCWTWDYKTPRHELSWCLVIPCCIARQERKLSERMNEWMVNSVSLQLASLTGTKKGGNTLALCILSLCKNVCKKKYKIYSKQLIMGSRLKKKIIAGTFLACYIINYCLRFPYFQFFFFLIELMWLLFCFFFK